MMRDGPRVFFQSASSSPFDHDALALFNRASVMPDDTRKNLINDFVVGIKDDLSILNLSDAFDCLWFLAAHDQQFSSLNWVENDHNLTEVLSPAWTLDRGFQGNGSTSYLRTDFIPSTDAVNYTLDNAGFGAYSRTEGQQTTVEIGVTSSGTGSNSLFRIAGDLSGSRVNNPNAELLSNTSGTKLISLERTASTGFQIFRDGSSLGTTSQTSTTLPTLEFYILAFNNVGTAGFFSTRELSMGYIAKAGIQTDLKNRTNTYLTALGAAV